MTPHVVVVTVILSSIKCEKSMIVSMSTRLSESVELSCSSPSPWFFCVWEGPRGDRICSLRSALGVGGGSLCGESDRMEITGRLETI